MKQLITLALLLLLVVVAKAQEPEILILPSQDSITVSFKFENSDSDTSRNAFVEGFMGAMKEDLESADPRKKTICIREYLPLKITAVLKMENHEVP